MKTIFIAALLGLLLSAEAFPQAPDMSGLVRDHTGNLQRVRYAFINPSTITSTQIVAAQGASLRIRVLAAVCVPTAANTLTFNSAASAISGTFPLATGQFLLLPYNLGGWFDTNLNEALNLATGVATATGCSVTWIATQ